MVAGIQSSRMNDQRAELPRYPGLNSQEVITQYLNNQPTEEPDDAFFEMLMRCQVNTGGDKSENTQTYGFFIIRVLFVHRLGYVK